MDVFDLGWWRRLEECHTVKHRMVLTAEVEECHTVKYRMVLTSECVWPGEDGKILEACHKTETMDGDCLPGLFFLRLWRRTWGKSSESWNADKILGISEQWCITKVLKHITVLKHWMLLNYWCVWPRMDKKHLKHVKKLKHEVINNLTQVDSGYNPECMRKYLNLVTNMKNWMMKNYWVCLI